MIPVVEYPEKASSMADLIARLPLAVERLEAALDGLADAELTASPFPGKWSVRETVDHIVNVSIGWTDIFFSAIDDVYQTPRSWSTHWTTPLVAELQGSLAEALALYRRHHANMARFLATLPPEDFAREFKIVAFLTEPFQIKESVNWGLIIHCDYHLATMHKLRTALGKPLPWMQVYLERYPKP